VVVTIGTTKRAKLQSECLHQQTNIQFFTDWMPFRSPNQQCQNTEGQKFITLVCVLYEDVDGLYEHSLVFAVLTEC